MHQERRIRAHPGESAIECRRQIGALIDVNAETLRVWIERAEVDAGARPGTTNNEHAELNRSRREVGELRRGIDILRTPAAFSQRRSSTANSSDLRLHRHLRSVSSEMSSTAIPVAVSQPKNAEPIFTPPKRSFSLVMTVSRSSAVARPGACPLSLVSGGIVVVGAGSTQLSRSARLAVSDVMRVVGAGSTVLSWFAAAGLLFGVRGTLMVLLLFSGVGRKASALLGDGLMPVCVPWGEWVGLVVGGDAVPSSHPVLGHRDTRSAR